MKNIKVLIGIIIIIISIINCKKEDTGTIPSVITKDITDLRMDYCSTGGKIVSDGGCEIEDYGICMSTHPLPTIDDYHECPNAIYEGDFPFNLFDFSTNTTYYVRAYAKNSKGITYGNEVSFIAILNQPGSPVTDIDGNVYHTVAIGSQVWMVENLKTTKYRDGTNIQFVNDNDIWSNLFAGAYCDYNNNPSNSNTYGRLYNWYAVTDTRNVCPSGWHIPSSDEWGTLYNFVDNPIGVRLKEVGTTHWESTTNSFAAGNNISGFTALPGGARWNDGIFNQIGTSGYWWTSSQYDNSQAYSSELSNYSDGAGGSPYSKQAGFSVRCIKD